jgi:DNA-binding response OmpR family regulator
MFVQEIDPAFGSASPHTSAQPFGRVVQVGCITLEPAARRVTVDAEVLALTAIEYEIAARLLGAAGRIVPRDEMIRGVFAREPNVFDRALDVHVSHLRAKLGARRSLIVTVRGVGHLFRIEPRT